MSNLKTLRDVSGLSGQPNKLQNSALVMIDLQNTYREGVMQLAGVEAALQQARRLLARARDAGIPVFHMMHDAGAGSPYDLETKLGQISDEVAPKPGESVLVKHYPNSFVETELDAMLREKGVKDLILAGFMTHMCVNSTARGGFNLGYRPTVVANTTATRDLPGPDQSVVGAAALQAASLAALNDLFAVVVRDADEIPA